jgi:hypothetical protein
MTDRPQVPVESLTRDQLAAIVVHQDSLVDAIIAINNGLLNQPGPAEDALRKWSQLINDTLEASGREIMRILAGDLTRQ